MKKKNRYLITGGTGSIGLRLVETLIARGFKNLVVVARDEANLIALKTKYGFIKIIAGDIADAFTCQRACQGVDGVFHLAAFKHIALAEEQTYRCVKTNVVGTLNLLEESKNLSEFFIMISTDKADKPIAIYSASKHMGEKIVEEFSKTNPKIKYRVVRFGNVWNTKGSFIEKWRYQIHEEQDITVTDANATRFFITKDEAIDLIFECLNGDNVKPFMPTNLKAISMGKVLEAFQHHYGKCGVKFIGLQPGENLHETLDGKTYSNEVEQYTVKGFEKKFICKE